MSDLIAIKPTQDPYISIIWQVNNFCNYRCSYCNEGNWSGKYRNEDDPETLISNLDKLVEHYQSQGYVNFKVFFSGGEPTVWKNLEPVMQFFKTKLDFHVTLAVNTNLSRSLKWWESNYCYFDDVVASYHPEFVDKERFFQNAEFLQDKLNYFCIRMMMLEEKFDDVVKTGNEFREKLYNYNLEWVPLLDEMSITTKPWEYSDPRITEFLKHNNYEQKITKPKPHLKVEISSTEHYSDGTSKILNSNRLVAENRNFFKGWTCNINECIFISPRGDMSSASCGQGFKLGNIFQNFKIKTSSIVCQKEYCHCGTDILITKHA